MKIFPKLAEATSLCGTSKLGWFRKLNISTRNSNILASPSGILRMRAKSQVPIPGPVKIFRPALPNVYGAGALKAEESRY